jgi:hypothetical protein
MMRQRLDALLHRYTMERRIAHINAVRVCMVQLDEVEAYAEEQEAALLHDRAQLATLADVETCPSCLSPTSAHLWDCRIRQAGAR